MPIRDRITWGQHNPFSDPRLADLHVLVRRFRKGVIPSNVEVGLPFENKDHLLPVRPRGYWKEYDVAPSAAPGSRGLLRIIRGLGGEVSVTGDHYQNARQVLQMSP